MKSREKRQATDRVENPKNKIYGEGDKRRKRNVVKKSDEPSESFSDYLAHIVDRKRAELRETCDRNGGDE